MVVWALVYICPMKIVLYVVFIFLTTEVLSQNIISNGSFENFASKQFPCPWGISSLDLLSNWESPNQGTPDLFCKCASRKNIEVGVPLNAMGYQEPFDGNCYAGIICFSGEKLNYKEYVSIKLNSKLKKGKLYCLSYEYSLANFSTFKMRSLGFYFSKNKLDYKYGEKLSFETVYESPIINDTINWQKFQIAFLGNGEEKYVTLGSFSNEYEKTKSIPPPKRIEKLKSFEPHDAYYYIDNVLLREINDSSECKCFLPDTAKKEVLKTQIVPNIYDSAVGKTMVLQNINFELNKATLLPSSYAELNKLVSYLQKNVNYTLELNGYTDNIGKEVDNLKLSESRAKAVADYLVQHNIVQSRISYKGFGNSKPIADNKTEQGRASNRRVEIIFK